MTAGYENTKQANINFRKVGKGMQKIKWLLVGALGVCVLGLVACGEDKTIYEGTATNPTTSTSTSTTSTTTTTLNGEDQFNQSCAACHTAAAVAKVTLEEIKANSMTMGLDDTQLQKIVDYLATK